MDNIHKVAKNASKLFTDVVEKYGYVKPAMIVLGGLIFLDKLLTRWGFFLKKDVKTDIVFITGGAMGIGKQMALEFAKQGAKVVVADINQHGAEAVAKTINETGGKAIAVFCDVSNFDSVREAASVVQGIFGHPTILVNNAGILFGLKLIDKPIETIEKTLQVNTVAHFYTIKQFLPDMLKNDRGHIVTIASLVGLVGVGRIVDYSTSKFGAVGLTESLRNELKSSGSKVRTTCVCPYFTNTGMINGVTLRHRWLMPLLEETYVAKRVVQAVRQETEVLVLPWTGNISIVLKAILPVSISDAILGMLGANQSMETFKGRVN